MSFLPHPGGELGSVQAERVRGALPRTTPCHSPGLAPACLHSHRLTLEGRRVCLLLPHSPCRPALAKALLGHSHSRCPGGPAQEHVSVSRPEAGAGSPTFQDWGRGRASGCGGGCLEGWGALPCNPPPFTPVWPGPPRLGRGKGWDLSAGEGHLSYRGLKQGGGVLTRETERVAAPALVLTKEGGEGCSDVASLMR